MSAISTKSDQEHPTKQVTLPESLPPELLRRFTCKLYVGYMPMEDRLLLLQQHVASAGTDVEEGALVCVAADTDGWSAADILTLARDASDARVKEVVAKHDIGREGAAGGGWKVTRGLEMDMEQVRSSGVGE